MTLQEKFSKVLAMLAAYPEPAVARFASLTFIRDRGPHVGVVPTAKLIREIPTLTFDQQHRARDLLQDAANTLKGPFDD